MKKSNKVIMLKNKRDNLLFSGNLALNNSIETKKYNSPKVKKLVFEKSTSTIVMGCWQQSYTNNGGDGC